MGSERGRGRIVPVSGGYFQLLGILGQAASPSHQSRLATCQPGWLTLGANRMCAARSVLPAPQLGCSQALK